MKHPLVLAITGASGVVYAARLLQFLVAAGERVHLTISPSGHAVCVQELGIDLNLVDFDPMPLLRERFPAISALRLTPLCSADGNSETFSPARVKELITYHHHRDFMTPIASGSFLTGGMVICPCSGSTLSGVVHASSTNLIQRAAEVHLKERRKLILVPRETPLSVFQLENMHRAAQAGAVVLPAMPGWYHGVEELGDLVDFVVSRILDQLGVDNRLIQRWHGHCDPYAPTATTESSISSDRKISSVTRSSISIGPLVADDELVDLEPTA